jgi:hypothetical protein
MNLYNGQFQPGKSLNYLHPNDDKNGECGGDDGGTHDSCGCFGNMCTCTGIYCVLYSFVYVYLFLFVTSLRTTVTE